MYLDIVIVYTKLELGVGLSYDVNHVVFSMTINYENDGRFYFFKD